MTSPIPVPEVRIRRAELSHIETIVSVVNEAFQVERFFLDHDRTDADDITRLFGQGFFLVAEAPTGEIVGCVYVEVTGDRVYLGMLSVRKSRQGNGLGRLLFAEAEKYARSQGCRFSDIRVVNLRTELPPYYRKLGYVETGTEPKPTQMVTNQPTHMIKMSKAL